MAKQNNNAKVAGAGILGAAIGAAVGAGAVALSDKKNQKFIKNKFDEYKKDGQKIYKDLKNKVEELTSEGETKVRGKVEEVKKTIKSKL